MIFDSYNVEVGAHGKSGYGTLVYCPDKLVSYFSDGNTKVLQGYISGDESINMIKVPADDSKSILTEAFTSWVNGKINGNLELQDADKFVLIRFPNDVRQSRGVPPEVFNIAAKTGPIVGSIHSGKADAIRHAL